MGLSSAQRCYSFSQLGVCLLMIVAVQGYSFGSQPFDGWKKRALQHGRVLHKRTLGAQEGLSANELGGSLGGYVDIREAPPKLLDARQHGKVVLECSASGTPAPQITWLKDGRPLFKDVKYKGNVLAHSGFGIFGRSKTYSPNIAESLSETKSKIELECLSQKDAGIYECVVSNGEEKKTVTTELNVVSFESNACQNHRFMEFDAVKPKIHQYMVTYMQMIGGDALLVCRAAGPHETYWIAPNGMDVDTKDDKYQMTDDGDLIIRNLAFEDMGMFQCLVKNADGHDRAETFVYPLAGAA